METNDSLADTEKKLAELWTEVLQCETPPTRADDFFGAGGDSMTMTMLEFRINEELSVELPPGVVLRAPTFGELVAVVDNALPLLGSD